MNLKNLELIEKNVRYAAQVTFSLAQALGPSITRISGSIIE